MKKNIFFFFLSAIGGLNLLFSLTSCNTTEPPIIPPPPVVKDTITVAVESFTHRSVTLNITSTTNSKNSSVRLIRTLNSITTTVAEFSILVKDTTIIDDNNGTGLLLDTTYTYFAVRVDSLGQLKDTSNTVTQKTLAPTSHNYTWQEFTIGEWQSALYDVWGTDENNVWAVGSLAISGKFYGALHWNGIEWIPDSTVGGSAIYGFNSNDIWVVGGGVYHFENGKWVLKDIKINNGHVTILDSVLFSNRPYTSIWGTSSSNLYLGNQWGKIIHWNGSKASVVYEKNDYTIADINGASVNNIWAVGAQQGGGKLFLHYENSNWIEDNSITYNNFLPASVLCFSLNDNFIAGSNILFGKKGKWSLMPEPALEFIHQIRGNSTNNVFVVGAYNLIMHYNGMNWYKYSDLSTPNGGVLYGVYVNNNKVFAVGIDETFSKSKIIIGNHY